MTKKFIAITNIGTEFMFKKSSMIAVPTSSAEKIAEALTKVKYKITDGEKWHVYENDSYYDSIITKSIASYSKNRDKITIRGSYGSYK